MNSNKTLMIRYYLSHNTVKDVLDAESFCNYVGLDYINYHRKKNSYYCMVISRDPIGDYTPAGGIIDYVPHSNQKYELTNLIATYFDI